MSDSKIASFLAEHPKMTGVLFTMLLLWSQVGTAMASNGGACCGP